MRLTRTPLTALLTLLAAALMVPPGVATADDLRSRYEEVVDITFPVAGDTSYINDYEFDRGGGSRKHQATDIMAPHGRPVHAAQGGEVSFITGLDNNPPSYGYMVTIRGDDGRSYSYIHLGRQDGPASGAYVSGLSRGTRVERGEKIGYVGSSGNASPSAPHLHFEIKDPSITQPYPVAGNYTHIGRINPYFSLRAAEDRGDIPGAEVLADVCETSEDKPFCDVSGGAHAEDIKRLFDSEVVRGCEEGRYCPDDTVTRAEAVALIVRGWDLPKADPNGFDDVSPNRWFAEYVGGAAAADVTEGCDERAFCPDRGLTRGEMASLLARKLDLDLDIDLEAALVDDDDLTFADLGGTTHDAAIYALAETDIARGYGDGSFRPNRDISRAEMASFIQRALDW